MPTATGKTLVHFYHAFLAQGWQRIVGEHLDALIASGLATELDGFFAGCVGEDIQRLRFEQFCAVRGVPVTVVAHARKGWEQVTLTALQRDPRGDYILYCHTKGAGFVSQWNDAWRRGMTRAVVGEWRECLEHLKDFESVGCHVLTGEGFPGVVTVPFFGGNMFWLRREVLARLPRPSMESRYEAEAWLGRGNPPPTMYDMAPGWPGWLTLYPEKATDVPSTS